VSGSVQLVGSIGVGTRSTSSTSVTGTYGQSPTAGNLLVAVLDWGCSTSETFSVTPPSGWTELIPALVSNNTGSTSRAGVDVWYLVAQGGDAAPTFTVNVAGTYGIDITIFELSGAGTVTGLILDTYGSYASGSTSSTVSFSATTSADVANAGDFAISCFVQEAGSTTADTWSESGSGWSSAALYPGSGTTRINAQVNYQGAPASGATLSDSGAFSSDTTAYGAGIVVAVAPLLPYKTLFGVAVPYNRLTTILSGTSNGADSLAFDSAGNLWGGASFEASEGVVPVATGTLFGTSVTANQWNTFPGSGTIPGNDTTEADGVAVDSSGNIYATDGSALRVLPVATGTIFGHSVTANTWTSLSTSTLLKSAEGLTFDAAGNLWASTAEAQIAVLPVASGTLFGVSVTANTAKTIVSDTSVLYGISFDAAGNLWGGYQAAEVMVLPVATGTLFGHSVTANTEATFTPSGLSVSDVYGVAIDSAGNLWLPCEGSLWVVPVASGTLFGVSVTANSATEIISSGLTSAFCVAFDKSGDLFIGDEENGIFALVPAPGTAATPVPPYTGGQVYQSVQRKQSQQALGMVPTVSTTGSFALAPLAFSGAVVPSQTPPPLAPVNYGRPPATAAGAAAKRRQQALGAVPSVTCSGSFALAPLAFAGPVTISPEPVSQYYGGQVWQARQRRQRQQVLSTAVPASTFALAPLAFSGTVTVSPAATGTFALAPLAFSGTASESEPDTGSFTLAPLAFSGTVSVAPIPPPPVTYGPQGTAARAAARRRQQALGAVPAITTSGSFALAPLAFSGTDSATPGPVATPYYGGQVWQARQRKRHQAALGKPAITTSGSFAVAPLAFSGTGVAALPFPQYPLPLKYELLINGTWTDITGYVYYRQAQVVTRGRPDETSLVQACECTFILNNRDGRFTPGNANGIWYPYIARNTQFRMSIVDAVSAAGEIYAGYRFWGEVSEWPPSWDPTQSDVYVTVTASGVIRRYQQGAKIGSALRRYYSTLTGDLVPYAVWPCEDASGSATIASLLSSVEPMTYTGTPDFAACTLFGGSDAIPVVNSSAWTGETGADADPPGTGSIAQVIPGTYTWICPPGVTSVDVTQATGSGGGGGDTDGTYGGGGGGGGGTSVNSSVGVTAGSTYTYVVPTGGAAGVEGAGSAGAEATWTGDSTTVTGHGGGGGLYSDEGGGSGGAGTHAGGAGAAGSDATPVSGSDSLTGYTGATGTGTGAAGDSQSTGWVCPDGVTSASVTAGGAGGGGGSSGLYGGGGGGGGWSSGTIDVSEGNTYTFYAGNGGNGAPDGYNGNAGGNSYVDGDSSTSVTADGGAGGNLDGAGGSGGSGDYGGGSGSEGSYTDYEGGTLATSGAGGGGAGSGSEGGDATAEEDNTSLGGSYGGGNGGWWSNAAYPYGGSGTSSGGSSDPFSYAGGGGGAGSYTGSSYLSAYGGGSGWIYWSWTGDVAPSGGGGGGSGGTAAAGNAGNTDGTGGAAVTNGGAGGNSGTAYPAYGSQMAASAGNGAAGKIAFNWDGGETSPVAADIVRFLLYVPPDGDADGVTLLQFTTYSDDVATVDVVYHTASSGSLELIGYNSSSSEVFDSGAQAFGVDGYPVMVEVQLISTDSGAGIEWSLSAIKPGADAAIGTYTGTLDGTVLYVDEVQVSPGENVASSAVGWISVQTYADPLTTLAQVINGYAGETAAARLSRLCTEENITFTLVGNDSDTPLMGPQQDDTLVNVFGSCESADLGQLFEPRDSLGLGYRTRINMQNQNPVVFDYSAAVLAQPFQPTADDEYIRNDVTVTRNFGTSYTLAQLTGAMGIYIEEGGVGDYTYSLTVYLYEDAQLASLVAWMVTIGTVNELRYPQVTFDLSRSEAAPQLAAVAGLDVGDYIQITRAPTFLTSTNINQLCWGFTETVNTYTWTIAINAVPEDPYTGSGLPTW
jgi:hypothetical protein